YIGQGMLTGAIAGPVFTSPPVGSIVAAIRTVAEAGAAGVLLLVKNYTGDRLNFGLALERAKRDGLDVEMVVIADDCAFFSPRKAGRRGLCGIILIHKLLRSSILLMYGLISSAGTLGVSLSPCSVPGSGPTFKLGSDEIELGLGIHGEAGVQRYKMMSCDEVVKIMIDHMTDPANKSRVDVKSSDSVILIVNNLGGLSCLELQIVASSAVRFLEGRGLHIERAMTGSFMTALEMSGVSLTLMKASPEILQLFDKDTSAPAWPRVLHVPVTGRTRTFPCAAESPQPKEPHPDVKSVQVYSRVLGYVCSSLLSLEEELNDLDRAAGDGDCGSTHARAAHAIKDWINSGQLPSQPSQFLAALSHVLLEKMGGTSGALYSLFLMAAAQPLQNQSGPQAWAAAMEAGIGAMKRRHCYIEEMCHLTILQHDTMTPAC
ncbi:hypothetical protein GDO78_003891, partial [Eleutherodactylus coqui]